MANYTILLIDYEPRSIERFRDPLVAAGYKVEIATDGVSGIAAFHRLNPDMVLVEAMIPKKHGFEVCQELKRTPHGRRTPILITTGVYKGRKYRTQALHIYGCDEYIEKPIAPEQLLGIVGKFFGSGASAPAERAPEAAPVSSEGSGERPSPPSPPKTASAAPATEASSPKSDRTKPAPIPKSSLTDDTEDEIMARLDAILPNYGVAQEVVAPAPEVMTATMDLPEVLPDDLDSVLPDELPIDDPVELESAAEVGEDPFAEIRSQLDAELASFSAALAVEISPTADPVLESIPSDQLPSPSVLEALPVPEPEPEAAIAPAPTEAPAIQLDRSGQLVNFDTKRSRKHKKSHKAFKDRSQQVAAVPTRTTPVAPPKPPPSRVVPEMKLPPGTLVESALEPSTARRGVPVWVWACAALVGIGVTYLALSRGGLKRGEPLTLPTAPIETASSETAPPAPAETAGARATRSKPAEAESKVADAPSTVPPSVPLVARVDPDAKKPLPAPPKATSDKATTDKKPAAAPRSKAIEQWKPAQPEARPLLDPEESVAGVEALPEVAAAAPVAAAVAPGTLVALDEADVMPVVLQRKLPTYSLQARQMRLTGTVAMNLLVNEFGTVEQVVLVSGVPGADLNDSAMRAAKSWTYRPATKQGVPVKVWKSEQIIFKP